MSGTDVVVILDVLSENINIPFNIHEVVQTGSAICMAIKVYMYTVSFFKFKHFQTMNKDLQSQSIDL